MPLQTIRHIALCASLLAGVSLLLGAQAEAASKGSRGSNTGAAPKMNSKPTSTRAEGADKTKKNVKQKEQVRGAQKAFEQ